MQKIRESGLTLPGEASDRCFWCIPLQIGVILIGILLVASAANQVITALTLSADSRTFLQFVLLIIATAPNVLGAVYYIRWFMNMEDADRKNGTFKACMLVVLSCFCFAIVELIYYIGSDSKQEGS